VTEKSPGWEVYERLIARLMSDQIGTDHCVTPNVRVRGRISGTIRQLDVVIEDRHDRDDPRRIVVDAKMCRRKVDVKDVESFLGLMQDVGATHGFLVCPTGYTKAAERRAQSAITLRLVPLDRIGDFDPSKWPACLEDRCAKGRIFWDGYPELSLVLGPKNPLGPDSVVAAYVHEVGKCDRCGLFHVHCLTCDDIMAVPDRDPEDVGHQCSCKLPWFWLASVEADGKGVRSAELQVVIGMGDWRTVDRRPV
jgi:hypothetical protein